MSTPPADNASRSTQDVTDDQEAAERDSLGILIDDSAGDAVVVHLRGEIDLLTSPRVGRQVRKITDQAAPGSVVIMDLTGVVFLDSLGITTLLNLHQQASEARSSLRLVLEPAQFSRRVLQLAGVSEVLDIYDSISEARDGRAG
ncbi:MAG TPA: STAS domain-containing protein [Pseudonocardia sp.]|jgi:anti-sigma B factor antagonist|nr:STAS domain-containing protein [Pseudonocardia sp.]